MIGFILEFWNFDKTKSYITIAIAQFIPLGQNEIGDIVQPLYFHNQVGVGSASQLEFLTNICNHFAVSIFGDICSKQSSIICCTVQVVERGHIVWVGDIRSAL